MTAFGLASDSFLPHGFCYQWRAALIWLHVVSDVLIAVAYLVISVVLLYFAQKRKDLHFRGLFLCFGIFIAACGATHIMEVVTLWVPAYWTSGVIKCLTALASVPTAVLVARMLPQALTLASAEQLRAANQELETQSQALRESEKSYRDLVEHSQDLICTHDENGILLSVNEAPLKILGYAREDILNKPLRKFVTPEAQQMCDEYLRRIQRDGFARGLLPVLTKSGHVKLWEYNNTLRQDGSRIVRGIAHDVTEQRRAEDALRESQRKFQLMAENINEIFWMIEPRTFELLYASPAYQQIWERPHEEIERDKTAYLKSIHPDDIERILEKFRRLETANHLEDEYRIVCHGGRTKWLYSRAFTARDSHGRLTTFVGTTLDVTARRRSEEALRQAQKMEAIGLVASGLAHDFNNILTVVLGHAQLLLKTLRLPDANKAGVQKIIDACFEGRELTAKLLLFGRNEASQPRPINLDSEIRKIEDMLKRVIFENIEVRVLLNCPAKRISAEGATVGHIIMNLALNARDAMASGGVLTIKTSPLSVAVNEHYAPVPPGNYALLEVIDTGHGMDEVTLAQMFEPFFTTKPTGQGTGLGLSMVYSIVRQCSGHIRVESELGRGSTFRIYLPFFEGVRDEASDSPHTSFDDKTEKGLIVVVEDNGALREIVREGLEDCGYKVRCEARGATALRNLESEGRQVRVLLTDVVMPDMTGVELARKARRQIPDLKILFMTGWVPDGISAAEDFGYGSDLIRKPFEIQELDERIRRLLSVGTKEVPD